MPNRTPHGVGGVPIAIAEALDLALCWGMVALATNLAPDGVVIPFADGHTRQLPRLTHGPFACNVYAGTYLDRAWKYATRPLKQAVSAPSALSLLYPQDALSEGARAWRIAFHVSTLGVQIRRAGPR